MSARASLAALVVATLVLALTGCSRTDENAVSFCQELPDRWTAHATFHARIPPDARSTQLRPYLHESWDLSEFLDGERRAISADGPGEDVRQAALQLLSILRGDDPVTGEELRREIERSVVGWSRTVDQCNEMLEEPMPCLSHAELLLSDLATSSYGHNFC